MCILDTLAMGTKLGSTWAVKSVSGARYGIAVMNQGTLNANDNDAIEAIAA